MSDCASFEDRLTALLAEEIAAGERSAALELLRRHAADCVECAGASTWVELAALPAAIRDPHPELPEGYWESFNARVVVRTERSREVPRSPRRRRYLAAAAILVALSAGWLLRGWWAEPEAEAMVAVAEDRAGWSELEEAIRRATPEELAAALRGLPGGSWAGMEASGSMLDDAAWSGTILPDTDELDDLDRSTLLEWLEQQAPSDGRPTS